MMRRKIHGKRRDQNNFSRTASRVHKKNNIRPQRGGIRL